MKTHRVMRRYSKPQPAFFTSRTLRKIDTKGSHSPSAAFSARFFSPLSRCGYQGRSAMRGADEESRNEFLRLLREANVTR
jgi:hypothetical protein